MKLVLQKLKTLMIGAILVAIATMTIAATIPRQFSQDVPVVDRSGNVSVQEVISPNELPPLVLCLSDLPKLLCMVSVDGKVKWVNLNLESAL